MKLFGSKADAKNVSVEQILARGDAARDRQDWGEAIDAYKTVLDHRPDLVGIWVQYAHGLKENGQIDAAIGAYRRAIEGAPDDAETYVHLAHTLKRLDQFDRAIEAFEKAVALNPSDTESLAELTQLQQSPDEPATSPSEHDQSKPQSANATDESALDKERNNANVARLAALQEVYAELQSENELFQAQIKGQQAEIERRQARLDVLEERDAAAQDKELELNAQLADSRAETEALRKEAQGKELELNAQLADSRAETEALRKKTQELELRITLAREEFLRSEGQVALIKDLVLREGGL